MSSKIEADVIHQMAFEEGQPADNGDGYLFTAEEFDLFVDRLLTAAAPVFELQPLAETDNRFPGQIRWFAYGPNASPILPNGTNLYTAPPELAELQATIARLTAENEALKAKPVCIYWDEKDNSCSDIERLKGGQGEPVAVITGVTSRKDLKFQIVILDNQKLHIGTKLYTSQSAPVSVGYKFVPLTPTPAMVQAGIDTRCGDDEHQDYRDVYTAMIGAAP